MATLNKYNMRKHHSQKYWLCVSKTFKPTKHYLKTRVLLNHSNTGGAPPPARLPTIFYKNISQYYSNSDIKN